MKAYILYLLLLSISFNGCKINKNTTQPKETKSTIEINCVRHNIQASYFTGKVSTIGSNEELVYAKVFLRRINGTENYGAFTDMDGKFTIKNVAIGTYKLEITYMGYDALNLEIEIKQFSNCVADVKLFVIPNQVEKPVIYLYPPVKQKVQVKLNYAGTLTHTYPKYPEEGWNVTAEPNGTLWDKNGLEYYALFWEGQPTKQIIPKDGFVVSGKETAVFLEEKLAYLGLNRREANEFIMYWLPRMEDNPYNFIHFAGKHYEQQAALEINPKPETIIRVMMLTKPLKSKINIPLQDLSALKKSRKGFTVVEWGGSVIENIKEEI